MSCEKDWIAPDRELPPNDVVVWTMDSGGHVQQLKRQNRLWFIPDGSMYVYYEPKFWKHVEKD
jgi:hypothetical protein